MLIKNLYIKKYTNILDFIQKEKIIQYDLCETIDKYKDIISYGIRVKSFCDGTYEEESFLGISENKILIENIIKYLYENSLDVMNFKDVVSDLLFKIREREEKNKRLDLKNNV